MVIGKADGVPVAVMQGRVHLYEGYSASEVAFPMRVMGRMGIRAVILTNAAGGINLEYKQGALVVIRDHINLQGQNPLIGANDERFGPRFPDMTQAYCEALSRNRTAGGEEAGTTLHQGVYAGLLGPSYETPAEIRYLRTIGADLVGMSTVPEVIAARHMGMKVLAISCVTNMAAGILDQPMNHEEVLETGERVKATSSPCCGPSCRKSRKTWRNRQLRPELNPVPAASFHFLGARQFYSPCQEKISQP